MKKEEIEEKYNLKSVYNHMIYFNDLEDYAVGVLAEDTNYLIRNYSSKYKKELEENIKLLKTFI